MTVIIFQNEEAETETTSVAWVTKLEVTGTVPTDSHYIIWSSAEITGTNTTNGVAVRVLIDGTERAFDAFIPWIANYYKGFSSMGLIDLTAGPHTLTMQFVCGTVGTTAKIRRARVLLMKH